MGAEQWASSKNSKLMRLFFFSIGRAFRAANWPWITLSRAENYAPRNDYNGSFKFSTRSRFSMGGRGRPFSFEPRRVRDEAIFRIVREWKRDSCSLCPSKKFTYVCGMDRTTGKGDLFPFFSFGRGRRTFLIFDNLILLGLKFSKSSGKFPSRKKTRPSNLTQTRRFSNRRTNGNEWFLFFACSEFSFA